MNVVKTGKITGTGAAINVSLGFVPDYVEVYNNNDAGSLWPTIKWWRGMANGSGLKTLRVVDNGSTGNASQNKVTTNGISAFNGSTAAARGFTIGADTDLNVNGEDMFFIAYRGTDGAFGKSDVNGAVVP